MWRSARNRARADGLSFTITPEDIRAAWPVDGKCPALGIRLEPGRGVSQDMSPTLDRLNPEWGYIPGNIAVISYAANRAKGNMRADELEKVATWMRGRGLA